jgi:hypothetical protein
LTGLSNVSIFYIQDMALTTTQQITSYYNKHMSTEVTFTKDVIRALKLIPKQISLKCLGYQWPCIIYSSSMTGAKTIVNAGDNFQQTINQAKNMVSLRFSYAMSEKADPISFFITAKVAGVRPYSQEKSELSFVALSYTQRPPDDLIKMLGELLEANNAYQKRKEERIIITPDVIRKTGIKAKDITVDVQGVPRKGILRDVSFSGAKILLIGVAKFLQNKPVSIRLEGNEPEEIMNIEGTIVRTEEVEGRKDIAALAIKFNEEKIPVSYKIRLNNYLKQVKQKKTDYE